jgi:hypothetical protein
MRITDLPISAEKVYMACSAPKSQKEKGEKE